MVKRRLRTVAEIRFLKVAGEATEEAVRPKFSSDKQDVPTAFRIAKTRIQRSFSGV